MIITVEGRPLNGPLKNSNTLKDPLMKGGSNYRERLASVFMDSIQKQKAEEQKQKAKEAKEAERRRSLEDYRDGRGGANFAAMNAAQKAKEVSEASQKVKEVSEASQKVKESVQQAKGSIEKDMFNPILEHDRGVYQQDMSKGHNNIVTHAEQKAKESAQPELTQPSKEIPTFFSAVSKTFDKHLDVSTLQPSQPPSDEELANFKKLSKANGKNNILHGRTLLSFITLTWVLHMCGLRTISLIWYYIWYYFIKLIFYLFILFVLFVIFNICLVIFMVIQKSLDISHFVVGGIAKGMQTAIDKAGFRIFGKNIKFLGFLQGPTNKVRDSDRNIPNTAFEVIMNIVYSFFKPYLK